VGGAWQRERELLHVAGWCSSCSDDGWLCASVQHLWVWKDALQARDTSQCNLVLVTRRNADVERYARIAGWCSSCSDDGWLCASVQHLWVWEDALHMGERAAS